MKTIKRSILVLSMLLMAGSAGAQDLKSAYFLDNYMYSYHFNQATVPDSTANGFFGLILSGVTAGVQSNAGLSDFVFDKDGALYNGFSTNVTADEFIGNLPEYINNLEEVNVNLLSVGARLGKGYLTVEANVVADNYESIPNSLFKFLKVGGSGNNYNINDISANIHGYGEVSIGYSYPVTESLRIGLAGKFLMGIAGARTDINNITANLGTSVNIDGKGTMGIASPFINLGVDENGNYDFSSITTGKFGFGGWGGALNIGIHWDSPIEGLGFDVAANDIGGISWKYNINGRMEYTHDYESKDLDDIEENLTHLMEFKAKSGETVNFEWLPTRVNVGVKYKVPAARWLSGGLMYSYRGGSYKYSDFRLGATVTPGQIISASINGGYTSLGPVFGGAFNLRLWTINIYAGIDSMLMKFNTQMIPVNKTNTMAKAGIVISIPGNR